MQHWAQCRAKLCPPIKTLYCLALMRGQGVAMATVTHLTLIGFTTDLMKNEKKRVEFSSFAP